MNDDVEGIQILDDIITGRVSPHIYAFKTNTFPNYLKIGDTFRPVSVRLKEWEEKYRNLEKTFEEKAVINEDVYFRDFSVHKFLENDLQKQRLVNKDLESDTYYSKEFFLDTIPGDLEKAIDDIKTQYKTNRGKYTYYDSQQRLPEIYQYKRGEKWELRPNQKKVVDNFQKAVKSGRTNLLMYAVMRFGKSFTSLSCAKSIDAKVILIVSAKADVKEEWKKTVESAGNFEGYNFLSANELSRDDNAIEEVLDKGETAAIFLTLQDLQGEKIKDKHKEVFNSKIDLLIVDETHFGARAQKYGKVLQDAKQKSDDRETLQRTNDDQIDTDEADERIKNLNPKIRIHLSGTPYRILMGTEFEKKDIISFVQFSDIVHEQERWNKERLLKDNVNEWDNPYYGFPQMVRFAFTPNKSSIQKMEKLRKTGVTFAFSALFEPWSIKLDKVNNLHKKFRHEEEVLDLLKVIDGTKKDDGLLGFLDYNKIKEGNMCRHIVVVLPYCGSCDAMEELIQTRKNEFRNLQEYEIINISGVEGSRNYDNPLDVKNKIQELENKNEKTITLTVNRMLTGSTVEQWDTMLYLKDTSSPQEYDQAIFRLQNQYIRELVSEKNVIKENLKPQTLLVDFDPNRMFRLQEQKSLIHNVNSDVNGNSKLKERLEEELRISPIITINNNKIQQVEATNILEAVSDYNNQRSIFDEVRDVPVDLGILLDEEILNEISTQSEFGSKEGLSNNAYIANDETDFDVDEPKDNKGKNKSKNNKENSKENNNEDISFEKKIQTYYQRILFFSFLSRNHVTSLSEIINVIDSKDNQRLANNLGLKKIILQKMNDRIDKMKLNLLDYKILNISRLSNDDEVNPIQRALTSLEKFNRMSESEIITSSYVCDKIISHISNDDLQRIINNNEKILDITSKSGEFALAFYKRLTQELGYPKEQVANKIYSIPTSPIAYEFTRRFYEILELNLDNIATQYTAYDLLDLVVDDKKSQYTTASKLIRQTKTFSEITLKENIDEGVDLVHFGAVVGNPPYQIKDGGAQASASPLYPKFIQIAKSINPNYMSFIIPTRWFAGGKGLDGFRKEMLDDPTIKELHDFLAPEIIFPNTNNRGGVCYFISDKNYNAKDNLTKIVTYDDSGIISESQRSLRIDGLNIFIRNSIGLEVLEKISRKERFLPLSIHVSPRKPFGIEGKFVDSDKYYSLQDKDKLESPIKCYGRSGRIGYIEREEIKARQHWVKNWKVYTPYANNIGTELSDDNQNTFIGKPNSVCTETFLVIGADLDLSESGASNLSKYLRTKFARYLHSLPKVSHHGTSKTYMFVPLEDFESLTDINWSLSLDEIDEQLFKKYNLTYKEKEHIRLSIKEMN